MKSILLLTALAFSTTVFAQDGNPTIAEHKKEARIEIDFKKVNENLAKIAQKIREKNAVLLDSVSTDLKKTNGLITQSLILTLAAKGKIFNELGLNLDISEMNLQLQTIDSATLQGTLAVNGYELTKKILSTPSTGSNKTSEQVIEENLARGQEACSKLDSINGENFENQGYAYLECVSQYHLLKSKNFSEFLLSVKPIAKKFKAVANQSYYKQLKKSMGELPYIGNSAAWFTYYILSGNDLQVCTKKDWTCRGEYVFVKLNGTVAASRLGGSLTITENKLDLALHFYSIRALTNLIAGSQSGESFDEAQYQILKSLMVLTDENIEEIANGATSLITELVKELKRLGIEG